MLVEPSPDAPGGPLLSTINAVGLDSYLLDVDLRVSVTHTACGQLHITLKSPGGPTIAISTGNGELDDDVFNGTVFDDQALIPISDALFLNTVVFSHAAPEGALGRFRGEDPNGEWTLSIRDDTGGEIGAISGWSLRLTTLPTFPPSFLVDTFTNNMAEPINNGVAVHSPIEVSGMNSFVFDIDLEIAGRRRALEWIDDGRVWRALGAAQLKKAGAGLSGTPRRAALAEAKAALTESLKRAPANPFAWSRLAYVEFLSGGETAVLERALAMSIATGRLEPRLVFSRLGIALMVWADLSPAAQRRMAADLRTAARLDPDRLNAIIRRTGAADIVRKLLRVRGS